MWKISQKWNYDIGTIEVVFQRAYIVVSLINVDTGNYNFLLRNFYSRHLKIGPSNNMHGLNRLIHPKGRPHHTLCIPAGCALTAAIGEWIVFAIQFYDNPDPDGTATVPVAEWNWTFVPANQDIHVIGDDKPGDVYS